MTREEIEIEEFPGVELICFETDREEDWYNIGLKHGLKIADEHPKSPWISVKEDLPCNHKELITTEGHYKKETINVITIDKYGIIEDNYMVLYDNDEWCWKYGMTPLYWMPIPKLPKE